MNKYFLKSDKKIVMVRVPPVEQPHESGYVLCWWLASESRLILGQTEEPVLSVRLLQAGCRICCPSSETSQLTRLKHTYQTIQTNHFLPHGVASVVPTHVCISFLFFNFRADVRICYNVISKPNKTHRLACFLYAQKETRFWLISMLETISVTMRSSSCPNKVSVMCWKPSVTIFCYTIRSLCSGSC